MADLMDIGSIRSACQCDTQHIRDMHDAALELFGLFLEVLWLYSKAKLLGDLSYLVEPCRAVVCVIVALQILGKELLLHFLVSLFVHIIFGLESLIIVETHEVASLLPVLDILTGLLAALANIQRCKSPVLVLSEQLCEVLVVLLAPAQPVLVNSLRIHSADGILGNIPELVHINQCARDRHLLNAVGEIRIRRIGVCLSPLLIV